MLHKINFSKINFSKINFSKINFSKINFEAMKHGSPPRATRDGDPLDDHGIGRRQ